MARFVKGDVVVIPFPFSDLSRAKRRPALVVAELEGGDQILCQITSQAIHDQYSIMLDDPDFESGGLKARKPYSSQPVVYCRYATDTLSRWSS